MAILSQQDYQQYLIQKLNIKNSNLSSKFLQSLFNIQKSIPIVNHTMITSVISKNYKELSLINNKLIENLTLDDFLHLFIYSSEELEIIKKRLNRVEVINFFDNLKSLNFSDKNLEQISFEVFLNSIMLDPTYENFIKINNFSLNSRKPPFNKLDLNNIHSFYDILKKMSLKSEFKDNIINTHKIILENKRLEKIKNDYSLIFNQFTKNPNLENLNNILKLNPQDTLKIFNLKLTENDIFEYFNINKKIQKNIKIEKKEFKNNLLNLEKQELESHFTQLKNSPSLVQLRDVLSLNKRKILKHFNIELDKNSVYSFLNLPNESISIIENEITIENKENEVLLQKRKWQSELLHSSTLFSQLNITKTEFDKWRKDGRIPTSDTQVFEKWGKTLTTTLHHPTEIAHINFELISKWRNDDKNKQKENKKIASNNEETKEKRTLTLKIKKLLIDLQKHNITLYREHLLKEHCIQYKIDDLDYQSTVFFDEKYNIRSITTDNIQSEYTKILNCFSLDKLKVYQESLNKLIHSTLINFKSSLDTLILDDKKIIYQQINETINDKEYGAITQKLITNSINESLDFIKNLQETKEIREILNIEKYEESFPIARNITRKFNVILGPTNSGKTFEALETLKNANSGVYLAPLRLLAMEIFDKLNQAGVPCNLHTGEEFIDIPGAKHTASTIEMMNHQNIVDVAVIDEVQMLADKDRGWAWTAAIVGVPANTIYCIGSDDIEYQLINTFNYLKEEYTIKHIERKCPLKIDKVVDFHKIDINDVIVTFSRKNVLWFAKQLEDFGFESSMIYGALSPEVRREQIENFSNGYSSCLVATDAIGMGINIPAKRIIFSDIEKFDGQSMRLLNKTEIKQIAGRAGRFGIHDFGLVSAFNKSDLTYIKECLESDNDVITEKLTIAPSMWHIHKLSEILETDNIIKILSYFSTVLPVNHHLFKISKLKQMKSVANFVQCIIPDETLENKFIFSNVPCNIEISNESSYLKSLLLAKKQNTPIKLFKLPDWITSENYSNLFQAEELNKCLTIYSWLHYKFPNIYVTENNMISNHRNKLSKFITVALTKINEKRNFDYDYYE